jgi:hypothetical protein
VKPEIPSRISTVTSFPGAIPIRDGRSALIEAGSGFQPELEILLLDEVLAVGDAAFQVNREWNGRTSSTAVLM